MQLFSQPNIPTLAALNTKNFESSAVFCHTVSDEKMVDEAAWVLSFELNQLNHFYDDLRHR